MLSYQHAYHAGNRADLHKHATLAWALAYLTAKEKPLTYLETHAGRGLYDLSGPEATKTAEAAQGFTLLASRFAPEHPFSRCQKVAQEAFGAGAYWGSPLIAAHLLRPTDHLHLAELHPREHAALRANLHQPNVRVVQQDGLELALSLCPPTPRRGLLLIDPSYEVKSDYDRLPDLIARVHAKWNVGVIMLWYPILTSGAERAMVRALQGSFPEALLSEARFPPARPGHGMVGSGLFVLNAPWGMSDEAARNAALLA
jgi:23S rRNA (adenine2030-N6)-methyltransferase